MSVLYIFATYRPLQRPKFDENTSVSLDNKVKEKLLETEFGREILEGGELYKFLRNGRVVKLGSKVTAGEIRNMKFVAQHITIPIPTNPILVQDGTSSIS